METEYIQEFVVLAETCSFQETAAQMFISQSSLTKHIQSIEKELGVPLFDRTTRSVRLNAYGARFYQYARQIAQLSQDYKTAIRSMVRERSGKLTIAFQSRLGQYGMIRLFSRFQKEYPQFPVKMMESNQVVRFLHDGECDFAISMEKTEPDPDITELICRTDHLAVVLPENHPLARETSIRVEQLRDEKMILHEDTPQNISWETRILRRLCEEAGFSIHEVMTVSFSANLVRMVEQGMGIGVINRSEVGGESSRRQVAYVDLEPAVSFHIKLLYHNQIAREPAGAAWIQFIRKMVESDYFHNGNNT